MKVLYVVPQLGPGGTERSLAELLPLVRAGGIDPLVVSLGPGPHGVEADVRALGVDVRVLGGSPRLLARVRRLRRIIRTERPDVVHTMIFDADLVGRVAAIGMHTTVVTSLVNSAGDPSRRDDPAVRRTRLRAVLALDGFTARHLTRRFHAVSDAVADDAVSTFRIDRERITVIERGRDVHRLDRAGPERRRAARSTLGLAEDRPLVVAVGRQEYQKGHDVLIDAVAQLRTRVPDVALLVAGRDGHASKRLREQVAARGLDDHVTFLGHRDDVPDVLAAADVFALPSRYEGLPGALIEAFTLEVPAAASDIAPVRAVATDDTCARLVPAGDVSAWADALFELLTDRAAAATMARNGRAEFEKRFTLPSSAERLLAFYRALPDGSH